MPPDDTQLFKHPVAISRLLQEGIRALSILPAGNFRRNSSEAMRALQERLEREPHCLDQPDVAESVCGMMNAIRYAVTDPEFPRHRIADFRTTIERCGWIEIGMKPGSYSVSPEAQLSFPDEWS